MESPLLNVDTDADEGLNRAVRWGLLESSIMFSIHRANSQLSYTGGLLGGNYRQYVVLALIGANPGVSAAELVRFTGIDKSDASSLLDRLEKSGLIARRRSNSDHRRMGLYLTPVGAPVLSQASKEVGEHELRWSGLFTVEERRLLSALLMRL